MSEPLGARLPLSRVKAIMRSDPDVNLVSQDAAFAVAAATVRPLARDYSCVISHMLMSPSHSGALHQAHGREDIRLHAPEEAKDNQEG